MSGPAELLSPTAQNSTDCILCDVYLGMCVIVRPSCNPATEERRSAESSVVENEVIEPCSMRKDGRAAVRRIVSGKKRIEVSTTDAGVDARKGLNSDQHTVLSFEVPGTRVSI